MTTEEAVERIRAAADLLGSDDNPEEVHSESVRTVLDWLKTFTYKLPSSPGSIEAAKALEAAEKKLQDHGKFQPYWAKRELMKAVESLEKSAS